MKPSGGPWVLMAWPSDAWPTWINGMTDFICMGISHFCRCLPLKSWWLIEHCQKQILLKPIPKLEKQKWMVFQKDLGQVFTLICQAQTIRCFPILLFNVILTYRKSTRLNSSHLAI